MMQGMRRGCRVRVFLAAAPVIVSCFPAMASQKGRVAAARVREESYRHILDDMLYTHTGDDRGLWGVEHDLARDNIVSLFSSYGLTVTLDPFYCSTDDWCPDDIEYYNVIGELTGAVYPDQIYVVGAHYDSVGNPGADDNASGTALVLEAARVLSAYQSDYTIRFIAFDREEQGLVGSENYVFERLDETFLGMISTDMVAFNRNEQDSVDIFGRPLSEAICNAMAQAVATYGEGVSATLAGPSGGSDHASFEWYGFPACLFIEDWGNPNYHTQRDTVDTLDYIDYAYATRNTRSVVGFLVDNAGVAVDIPDADYDTDGDVDMDDYAVFATCFSGEDVPPDPGCVFFDFESDGDVDCADWDLFAAVWTGPGDPPVFWPCRLLEPVSVDAGGRCLVVAPPVHGLPMALLVTGDPDDPNTSCLSQYVQADGTLGNDPVFQTYDVWGTVTTCDQNIVPDTRYKVSCDYGQAGMPRLSPARSALTPPWGDTVGYFTGTEWTPPDGTVGIVDVVAIIDRFRSIPDAPPVYRVDLVGVGPNGIECSPDQSINMIDAVAALDGFQGTSYWESTSCAPPCAP